MRVHESAAPDSAMPNANIKDFAWRRSQWFGIGLLGVLLIALTVVLLNRARHEGRDVVLLVLLGLILLINVYLAYSRLRNFRRIWVRLQSEHEKLEEANLMLKQVDIELKMRLDRERTDRAEREWFDLTVHSISSQFKSTIDPDSIAESLVKDLGHELKVDVVLFYSFPNFPMQRMWKQWHQRAYLESADSLVIENESDLLRLSENLWNDKRTIIVNDSYLFDVSHDPIPKLAAIAQMRARSWVLVPFGAGTQVLGCLGIGMFENVRVWTAVEIELVQKVISEAAEVFTRARLFRQSMQIAENNSEVERLTELHKVKNAFIENMNHELRTPLTSIIGYMGVIMDDFEARDEPQLVSSLTAVQRNAIRLQMLIENMMQISIGDFEHVSLVVSTVDVGRLLGDVANSMQFGAEDSGVRLTLRFDSPETDLTIDGDLSQLEQVFVNLVSNAIKFTPRGGTVTIVMRRAYAEADFVEVKVIDTGIGIPVNEFPDVFKRFFRASTATQVSIPGFGIGLSLAHAIVGEHHGTITFDSNVGKGTVFTVTLPTRYVPTEPAAEIE